MQTLDEHAFWILRDDLDQYAAMRRIHQKAQYLRLKSVLPQMTRQTSESVRKQHQQGQWQKFANAAQTASLSQSTEDYG